MRTLFKLIFSLMISVPLMAFTTMANAESRLDYLRFVDIRDLLYFGTDLKSTSNLIVEKLLESTSGIARYENSFFYRNGARGNRGNFPVVNGKETFQLEKSRAHTRKNTILHLQIEEIEEIEFDKVFKLKILLFEHNDKFSQDVDPASNGYFFRRLTLDVDWNKNSTEPDKVIQISGSNSPDISLRDTNFSVLGSLYERKVILEDRANGIKIVFPIGVGSVDVRTAAGMDGKVQLLTPEFPQSVLKKVSIYDGGSFGSNTRERNYPSYYKGRPFFGLFRNGTTYDAIGMHYQIDDDVFVKDDDNTNDDSNDPLSHMGLLRGFVSHGCIRTRDRDLYVLDAILNEGPHNTLYAHIVNNLVGYESIDHPMPKIHNWYNQVVYSSAPVTTNVVQCENSTYTIRPFGNLHTVADSDCLTMVTKVMGPKDTPRENITIEAIAYMLNVPTFTPSTLISNNTADVESSEGGADYLARRKAVRQCGAFGTNCVTVYEAAKRPQDGASKEEWTIYVKQMITEHTAIYQDRCNSQTDHKDKRKKKMCQGEANYLNSQRQWLKDHP